MVAATIRSVLLILAYATTALAADQQILGRKLQVRNPDDESARKIVVLGRQSPSSLTLVGDPTVSGASLQIVANGPTGSTQVFALEAAGWRATARGFVYVGPTTGDPVRRVVIRRATSSVLKAILRGRTGTADLAVTPPNPGDDGGLVLGFTGGDRYCVSLGGAAGGSEQQDDAEEWTIVNATAAPGCPFSPSITTTTTTSSTTSTAPQPCSATAPACGGVCPAGYQCESAGVGCGCFKGGSGACTTCDPPCAGGDECTRVVEDVTQFRCGCATPPVCSTSMCGGNCPTGSGCPSFQPCVCFDF
jgi:hypothetical protein